MPCDVTLAPSRYPIDTIAGRELLGAWDRGTIAACRPRPPCASFSAEEEVILQGTAPPDLPASRSPRTVVSS